MSKFLLFWNRRNPYANFTEFEFTKDGQCLLRCPCPQGRYDMADSVKDKLNVKFRLNNDSINLLISNHRSTGNAEFANDANTRDNYAARRYWATKSISLVRNISFGFRNIPLSAYIAGRTKWIVYAIIASVARRRRAACHYCTYVK